MDIELFTYLSDLSTPIAFLVIGYLALKLIAPIIKSFLERLIAVQESISDTQESIAETLRGQAIMLHTLEQRVTRIENRLGSNTRRTDKES